MKIGVLKESFPEERRVALTPISAGALVKKDHVVCVEKNAGKHAGFLDEAYEAAGCTVCPGPADVIGLSEVLPTVYAPPALPEGSTTYLEYLSAEHTVIGFADPVSAAAGVRAFADTGARLFAVELVPRITRAQSMDALSSMATISGYKIVLSVANRLPKMFPLMMTAAGTVSAAKVLVIGAGVAGLQAIATARRLGGIVTAYDVRPAAREQVESLGATFVELDVEAEGAEDAGGYATSQSEDFYRRQQDALAEVVARQDVVITTALIPGQPAPLLLTADMVHGMTAGSIVADMAAERGGNCELTQPGHDVDVDGVLVMGPTNIPSTVPFHASQMYARNMEAFLGHLTGETGALLVDTEDEITKETLVVEGGTVVNDRVLGAWGL